LESAHEPRGEGPGIGAPLRGLGRPGRDRVAAGAGPAQTRAPGAVPRRDSRHPRRRGRRERPETHAIASRGVRPRRGLRGLGPILEAADPRGVVAAYETALGAANHPERTRP
jgi:hypothetical protein